MSCPQLKLFALCTLSGLLICLPVDANAENVSTEAGEPVPATAVLPPLESFDERLDEPGHDLLHAYFSREVKVLLTDDAALPFEHPALPTLQFSIGGRPYPLIFDTGSYSCILSLDDERWPEPPGLIHSEADELLALLEAKQRVRPDGTVLDFAVAPLFACDGLRLRNVPLRLYENPAVEPVFFAGSFSAFLLRDYVIEVANSRQQIRLYERSTWLPGKEPLVLPLLTLPRGCFIPLMLGERQYLFHFDSGFSGTIGLAPQTMIECAPLVERLGTVTDDYHGWKQAWRFEELQISALRFPAYSSLLWSRADDIEVGEVIGVEWTSSYAELEGFNIGGIVGSGLLQHYDYALDFELSRMYLWERD